MSTQQLHRCVHAAEHDPSNGKLHGHCILCGVPYPCKYIDTPTANVSEDSIDRLFNTIGNQAKEIKRLQHHVDKLSADKDLLLDRFLKQIDYGIGLQKIIEDICKERELRTPYADALFRYEMVNVNEWRKV